MSKLKHIKAVNEMIHGQIKMAKSGFKKMDIKLKLVS